MNYYFGLFRLKLIMGSWCFWTNDNQSTSSDDYFLL